MRSICRTKAVRGVPVEIFICLFSMCFPKLAWNLLCRMPTVSPWVGPSGIQPLPKESTMKITQKAGLLAAALLWGAAAQADFSANIGWASEYHYRGIFQHSSSANGGIDYESNGIYVGSWAADVGDGLEVDGYFGYGGEAGDFTYGLGFTGYYYTGDFDDTYQEINLSAGYGIVTLEYSAGQYENFSGPTQDYGYYAFTVERNGFYGKYAGFTEDFAGEYVEVGYGTTVAGLDIGLALIFANKDLLGEADESAIFSIGKSFDFPKVD
jgi:uncharacterized protein (TIGR02001 family)